MRPELTETEKKAIFRELVSEQDKGVAVVFSRARVARHFKVGVTAIRSIERLGIAKQWPPLG